MQNIASNMSYPSNNPNGLVYTEQTLHPYNSQQFLVRTFGYNTAYIDAFLTLPHEEKLKMYLSVEEMRMIGKMNDRQGYENILKQLARRVAIIKPQTQKKAQQKQQIDWGHKLEDLCENHLKKIQQDDLLDDIPLAKTVETKTEEEGKDFLTGENSKQEEEEDWEWNGGVNESPRKRLPQTEEKAEEEDWEWEKPNNVSPNQENKQIFYPLDVAQFEKPEQPIDIWSLNVDEEEKEKKKVISEILKSKEDQEKVLKVSKDDDDQFDDYAEEEKIQQPNIQFLSNPYQQSYNSLEQPAKQAPFNLIQQFQQTNQPVTYTQSANIIGFSQQNQVKYENNILSGFQIPTQETKSIDQPIFDFNTISSTSQPQQIEQVPTSKSIYEVDLSIFESGKENTASNFQEDLIFGEFSKKNSQVTNQVVQETKTDSDVFPEEVKSKSNYEQSQQPPKNNHWSTDFQFLEGSMKGTTNEPEFSKNVENQVLEIKTEKLLSKIDNSILSPLRSHIEHRYLKDQLEKLAFELDKKFYTEAKEMISQLGFQEVKDFDYLDNQEKICDEIVQLTERYTSAVEIEEENIVKETIAQSKMKYTYLSPKKTFTIVDKYLKMEGRGLHFRVGELVLEAGVPKNLIEKVVSGHRNVITNFTVLYALECLSSLGSINSFAKKLIIYFQNEYKIYKEKKAEMESLQEFVQAEIQKSQAYRNYRIGLSKVANLCKRMLAITKISCTEKLHSNPLKLGKQMKDVDVENEDNLTIIPEIFMKVLEKSAKQGQNVYTLYTQFTCSLKKLPICSLCLRELKTGEQMEKNMHFSCHNMNVILEQQN